MKKKKLKNFQEFSDNKSSIENFEPPKYVCQPAENDKGFFMFKAAFDKTKKRFVPHISY